MPWGGLLLDAHAQPAGATLTLRVASPGRLPRLPATVTVQRSSTPAGQPVIGCTPLQPVAADLRHLGPYNPDPTRRNGQDGQC